MADVSAVSCPFSISSLYFDMACSAIPVQRPVCVIRHVQCRQTYDTVNMPCLNTRDLPARHLRCYATIQNIRRLLSWTK
jgi:hypothetical protein